MQGSIGKGIPYGPQLIPHGNYRGVVKEIQEALVNARIELIENRHPRTNGSCIPFFVSSVPPKLVLPWGFLAYVVPRNREYDIRLSRSMDVFSFYVDPYNARRGDLENYLKGKDHPTAVVELFDPTRVTLDSIHLRKTKDAVIISPPSETLPQYKFERVVRTIKSAGFSKISAGTEKMKRKINHANVVASTGDVQLAFEYRRETDGPGFVYGPGSFVTLFSEGYKNGIITSSQLEMLEEICELI